ncbi:pyruvate, water dikinase [Rhizobiales bacterium GAS191]|nr:pyruvate, water dikinase [Rhizobiales bacterium GAS191]SEE73624.1 pyruvate, water dikinase [Rhizobiales bacterium GAS188]
MTLQPSSLVLPFTTPSATDKARTGGKGASLAISTIAGLPVPQGFVVTADAYRTFAAGLSPIDLLEDATIEMTEEWAARRRQEITGHALPRQISEAIAKEVAKFPSVTRFAVRSSGTMEDLAEAAFAGQHDTYLGLSGPDAIIDGVLRCFASLWTGRAVAYRARHGFAQSDAAMAVVVQIMVDAEAAGVAFTVDPVGGRMDRVLIEAAWGLGETVVSGESETDQFIIDKNSSSLVGSRIGHKPHALRLARNGTDKIETGADADRPSLTPDQITQITKLALGIEARTGFPQDIEWAIADGKVYLLQARPVTSIPERWTRDESAERFPNPVTPLTWDMVEVGFHDALSHSFEIMGLPPFDGKWFAVFDGYVYGNQNAVETYMGRPPMLPKSLDELRMAIPTIRAKFAWVLDLPGQWMLDLDSYLLSIGALSARNLASEPLEQVWRHVAAVNDLGRKYFRSNIAISITQSLLNKALHYGVTLVLGHEKAPTILDDLLGCVETKTATINREIKYLSDLAKRDEQLRRWFLNRRSGEAISLDHAPPAFGRAFRKFLTDHGHRELDFDPYRSNWLDSPEKVFDTIGLALRAEGDEDPKEREMSSRRRAREAEETLMANLPEDLRFFFHELIRLALTYTSLDDLEHYQTSRLTIPMRAGLREIGQRMRGYGVVQDEMDVFFAKMETLARACTTPLIDCLTALRDEIAAKKTAYLKACASDPAWNLGEVDAVVNEGGLKGIPGSPGVAVGPVRIVRSTDDFASFPTGAILVARTTNPAWTPLFHAAKGVIVESGGPLSHGAVTAREMRIPAVMAVRSVLVKLRDGDVVRVDGRNGTVEILQSAT